MLKPEMIPSKKNTYKRYRRYQQHHSEKTDPENKKHYYSLLSNIALCLAAPDARSPTVWPARSHLRDDALDRLSQGVVC